MPSFASLIQRAQRTGTVYHNTPLRGGVLWSELLRQGGERFPVWIGQVVGVAVLEEEELARGFVFADKAAMQMVAPTIVGQRLCLLFGKAIDILALPSGRETTFNLKVT